MAQQNIWKKQAQLNRMKAEGISNSSALSSNSGSPINAFNKNTSPAGSPLPWVKNNEQNSSPSQPSWANSNSPQSNSPSVQASWNNKTNIPQTTTSSPKQSSSQMPWAKNSTNNQPSWMKNNTGNQPNTNQSQPSWAKNNINTPNNQSSWVKKTDNPSQPSWAKNNNKEQTISSNTPSWIKDKKTTNDNVNNTSWKLQQSFEIEKQKKQLSEQIQRQQLEEKERKRIQKQKRQREEEQKNRQRQGSMMQNQDQESKARQQFDKEEKEKQIQKQKQLQRQREEEIEQQRKEQQQRQIQQELKLRQQEKKRKQQQNKKQQEQEQRIQKEVVENQKRQKQKLELDRSIKTEQQKKKAGSRRRKKQFLQTSKISSIKAVEHLNIANDPNTDHTEPSNYYIRYLFLINEQIMEYDYKKKISLQKSIYHLQLECRKDCQKQLINLFKSKKITNRKRKYIFSNSMQIQYALCEGKKQESRLYFDHQEMQELKYRFLKYEILTKCVLNLMKKKISLHLRVPLLNYAEYKGVSFLVEHVCQQLVDIIQIEIGLFQEIANEVLVFEKELQLCQDGMEDNRKITKDQLMAKKITMDQQDYYVLYLKNEIKPIKSKQSQVQSKNVANLQKISTLNDLNILEYLIRQNSILPYYNSPLEITKEMLEQSEKISSPALQKMLKNVHLAKAIQTVYCSCQGQVQEQSFFQLVLQGNKQIWDMISDAGCIDRDIPNPIVLAIIQKITSVRFRFHEKMFSRKNKGLIQSVRPSVFIQRYEYQLSQFIKNMDKYIAEDKQELVQQSMNLSQDLLNDTSQRQSEKQFNFLRLKNEVNYLLYKQKQNQATQLINQTLEKVKNTSLQSVPVQLLALRIFVSKDMEVLMLNTLSELLPTLEMYFGDQSMIHALVYTAVGIYYSKKKDDSEDTRYQKVITFYEHALNIILKLYGQKSQEVADIYLSRASAFVYLQKFQLFQRDIQSALKIYKMHSKSGSKIAECNHLMGRVKCLDGNINQGIQLMQLSSSQYMKMYNHIQSLCILFQILPFLENKQTELETKIEKIVEICFTYKSIWAFRRISTIVLDRQLNCYTSLGITNLQELFPPLNQDQRTNEQVLIDLQEEIKGFTSFIQIIRWALSIIAGKLSSRRENTGDYEKAQTIIEEVFHFYGPSQNISIDLKDSQMLG